MNSAVADAFCRSFTEQRLQIDAERFRITAAPVDSSGTLSAEVRATYEGGVWVVENFNPDRSNAALPMSTLKQATEEYGLELIVQDN